MKIYKQETVPEKTYNVLVSRACDLCGAVGNGQADWKGGSYEVNETQIEVIMKQREGVESMEGGSGRKYDIDICPKCFKEKLVPWLISQGAKIKQENWDW